jgi:hypothetical protein
LTAPVLHVEAPFAPGSFRVLSKILQPMKNRRHRTIAEKR